MLCNKVLKGTASNIEQQSTQRFNTECCAMELLMGSTKFCTMKFVRYRYKRMLMPYMGAWELTR